MNQSELEALLGRSLTPNEVANLTLYLDIATENLETILCISLSTTDVTEARVFIPREGYRTVYTDPFTDVSIVTVNGNEVTYYPAFWDKRTSDYYNSIVLDKKTCKDVTITATWGFPELPSDLKQLLARSFSLASQSYKNISVKTKRVEDFSITYEDLTDDEAFGLKNAKTIHKYSQCDIINVVNGKVCSRGCYCG